MNYGKKKPLDPELSEQTRTTLQGFRAGSIFNAFVEPEGIINKSALARQYFHKSQGWLSQRINGGVSCDKKMESSADEARQLADAFKDIARRLDGLAREIEDAADRD